MQSFIMMKVMNGPLFPLMPIDLKRISPDVAINIVDSFADAYFKPITRFTSIEHGPNYFYTYGDNDLLQLHFEIREELKSAGRNCVPAVGTGYMPLIPRRGFATKPRRMVIAGPSLYVDPSTKTIYPFVG